MKGLALAIHASAHSVVPAPHGLIEEAAYDREPCLRAGGYGFSRRARLLSSAEVAYNGVSRGSGCTRAEATTCRSYVMSDKTKEELASEARRLARIHQEVAERLRNDPNCIYEDAEDGGEGISAC
jgi:hypothetical protein